MTNSKKKNENFVDKEELYNEIKKSQEDDKMSERLGELLLVMVYKYRASSRGNFVNYSFLQDMQSFALVNLLKAYKKFDCEKFKNPFAFITTCIHNSFLQYLAKEKRQRNIRDALLVENNMSPSFKFIEEYEENEKKIDDIDMKSSDDLLDLYVDHDIQPDTK